MLVLGFEREGVVFRREDILTDDHESRRSVQALTNPVDVLPFPTPGTTVEKQRSAVDVV